MKKDRFYKKNTIKFTKAEIEAITVTHTKRQHRLPVICCPRYEQYLGKQTWEDDFNNQGKHAWTNGKDYSYAVAPFEIGDTVKIEGTNHYIEITDIYVKRIQNFTEEDITKEGKNYFVGKTLTPNMLDVLIERYGIEWDYYVGEDEILNYGYYSNPYTWVIEFRYIFDNKAKKVDKNNKRKNL